MVAGAKPVRFDHGRRVGEAVGEGGGVVGVAAEGDRLAAFVVPPAHDVGMQRHAGVDFECASGLGEGE